MNTISASTADTASRKELILFKQTRARSKFSKASQSQLPKFKAANSLENHAQGWGSWRAGRVEAWIDKPVSETPLTCPGPL